MSIYLVKYSVNWWIRTNSNARYNELVNYIVCIAYTGRQSVSKDISIANYFANKVIYQGGCRIAPDPVCLYYSFNNKRKRIRDYYFQWRRSVINLEGSWPETRTSLLPSILLFPSVSWSVVDSPGGGQSQSTRCQTIYAVICKTAL